MSTTLTLLAFIAAVITRIIKGNQCDDINANSLQSDDEFKYTFCGQEDYPQCILSDNNNNNNSNDKYFSCTPLDFYKYTGTDVDICGCNEEAILSNIVVLIDGTNHSDDYSWYFWSTSLPKLWYYDIIRYQAFINITFIYYGTNVEYIKTGDPVQFFGSDWSIPTPFINDKTPNLCKAFDAAINIFNTSDKKKILILLSNTTPYIPNKNIFCINNISLNDINIYTIKSSPKVNLSIIEQQYGDFDACSNIFDQYNPNWARYFDENDFSYKTNMDVYNYLNIMVSTISDFICQNSDICTYINYSKRDQDKICSFSCINDDYSCFNNNNNNSDTLKDSYYIFETYNGSKPLLLTQNKANNICNKYGFGSLASINTNMEQERIISLMEFYNSSNCWIGLNITKPIFTIDNTQYFQWMDGSINSLNFFTNSNYNKHCISISNSGEWIINDCNDVFLNCFICNSMDSAILTVSNDKYHIINSIETKTSDEANEYCIEHYYTHSSTIQSYQDQNDIINALTTMDSILKQNISPIIPYQISYNNDSVWIGDVVYISYDDCIDYYDGRSFNELWSDGSSFNFTLLNYESIIHETCAPAISPTQIPSINPTISPTTNSSETNKIAPISPTYEPTNNPTLSPTIQIERHCSISVEDGSWKTRSGDDALHLFSCNVMDRAEYAIQSEDYYVFHGSDGKTWQDADRYCDSIHGTKLSTIYASSDQNEIITLRDKLRNKSVDNSDDFDMWIGMRINDEQFSDAEIKWRDGSKSNYSRLNSGCLVILQDAEININDNSWIIDSCDDIHYTFSCNNFVPTPYPSTAPTLVPTENIIQQSYADKLLDAIKARPFETFYVILVIVSLILTVAAFLHAKNVCFCCVKCGCCTVHYADDAKWATVIVYGLQIWDFLSDCSFAYNLDDRMSILFILSSSFILVPWICNICFLFIFRYQHSINNNFETNKWFRDNSYKLVLITMLCGSANTSINLMNSKIFGLNVFNMGLTKLQLIETTKFKVILTTALENMPQIVFTMYYIIITQGITDFAIASLISSTLSVILVIVVTIIFSIDPLNDEYMEMTLKYNEPLETENNDLYSDLETNLLKRFGFHKRIAQSLAYSFGQNTNLVNVDKHRYNMKNKTVTLLISINTNNTRNDGDNNNNNNNQQNEENQELQNDEARTSNIGRNSIIDNLINKMDSKYATLMIIKLLESIRCSTFLNLFYQINLLPLNKNGIKKLPFSKKIKLDPNLMSDLTMFDENELAMSSSLLRAGSSPNQSVHLSNQMIDINDNDDDNNDDDNNDEDEMMIHALPPRPISMSPDDEDNINEIEMVQKSELNKQFSSSTRL